MLMVGQRIAKLRSERGIEQVELARRVGTTQASISRLETGRNANPSFNTLVRLADALQVPVAALVAQEETAQPAA